MKTNHQLENDIDEAINNLIDTISNKYNNKPIAAELFLCFMAVVAELSVASGTDEREYITACLACLRAAQAVNNERMN